MAPIRAATSAADAAPTVPAPPAEDKRDAPIPGAAIRTALHRAMSMARAVPVRAWGEGYGIRAQ